MILGLLGPMHLFIFVAVVMHVDLQLELQVAGGGEVGGVANGIANGVASAGAGFQLAKTISKAVLLKFPFLQT